MTRVFTLAEAAAELRKSKRWLQEWLSKHPVDETGTPFYVPMGRSKTFEEADISRIRAFMREEERRRLSSIGVARAAPLAKLPVGALDRRGYRGSQNRRSAWQHNRRYRRTHMPLWLD
jgi:hypothetical protein